MIDLSSANWKIDRAVELLGGLDGEVLAWVSTTPYSSYVYVHPNYRRAVVKVREHNAPPKIRWSLIFADIIHNLRCALDHAFWTIIQDQFSGEVSPDVERLSFPIWDTPPSANQRRNFKPLSPKILAAIESVQPYKHPNTIYPVHPLAIIRDIDNGNKHRLLFTVVPSIAKIQIKVSGMRRPNKVGVTDEMYRGEIKDGIEAVVTTFDAPEPYVKYECTEFMTIIAVMHPTANRLGQDRDDYAALVDALIVQVRMTIADLVVACT